MLGCFRLFFYNGLMLLMIIKCLMHIWKHNGLKKVHVVSMMSVVNTHCLTCSVFISGQEVPLCNKPSVYSSVACSLNGPTCSRPSQWQLSPCLSGASGGCRWKQDRETVSWISYNRGLTTADSPSPDPGETQQPIWRSRYVVWLDVSKQLANQLPLRRAKRPKTFIERNGWKRRCGCLYDVYVCE